MDKRLIVQFQNPPADKRSLPFWAWNEELDEEELKSQVGQMKEAGVGGFFIHSRIGLETEYMGEKWMRCVKAVVAEAKAQGLQAWLYDEDRWPSGTAGGKVTSGGDAYRCKGLTVEVLTADEFVQVIQREADEKRGFSEESIGVVAAYRITFADAALVQEDSSGEQYPVSIQSFERLSMGEALEGKERKVSVGLQKQAWLIVRLQVSAPSEWFNNESPPDNLNPDCVRRFLSLTHEKYKEAVGEEFGKTIPGIFTDEPSLNDRFSYFGENRSWIPWTYGFGAYFREKIGYDFLEVLPLFYFHGEGSAKVRHDYWCCVTQRYSESYFKVIGEWCEANHLLFTGHFLQEDKLGLCTRVNGAVMPHYQYQHVPGIDMLCEQTGEYLTVKQCTSVANQLGKKQVLSETYGCTGWDFTFEGQKWMGDWQYVLGVNRRCQHLMLYSLRGCRKRDYPPSFNYNINWWRENKIVEDYFARLSVVLEQGRAVRELLLLHPSATAWCGLGVDPYGNPVRRKERDVPSLNAYGDKFNELIEYLVRRHLDCDLGDELLLESFGRVEEGRFIVGEASYSAVIVPPVDTLRSQTIRLLRKFMEQGGMVYAYVVPPFWVDGGEEGNALLGELIAHKNWIGARNRKELISHLAAHRTIRLEDEQGQECKEVLCQLRQKGRDYYLFVVNNSRSKSVDFTIKLPFPGRAYRMEALTGAVEEEGAAVNKVKGLRIPLHLSKTGSALFCIKRLTKSLTQYDGDFPYRLDRRNVLPLDKCRYRMDGGAWSEELEVWQAQKCIREALGMRPIHQNGIEQRYKWINMPHPEDGCRVELAFSFTTNVLLENVALAMERPEDFVLMVNGSKLQWTDCGWLLDKTIRKSMLPKLAGGMHEIILTCDYRNDMELENIYLEGDFGVDEARCLTTLPQKLQTGSWTMQGLKHYCGSVTYRISYWEEIEAEDLEARRTDGSLRILLRIPKIEAVCVKVRINAHEILLPWSWKRELSIEKWILPGDNSIELEVVGSPRNMMGPFHLHEKPVNTNDASFCPGKEKHSAEYLLVPYGLMDKLQIIKIQ